MKIEKPSDSAAELRRQAEAQLKEPYIQGKQLPSVAEALRLVHELQVHQVELELQNHALLEMRTQLEQSVEKYTDLYDFAPVGYFSIAADGNIQELNLAGASLLGAERARLMDRRFAFFISADSRPAFNAFLDAALAGVILARCEIILEPEAAPPRHLHLEGIGAVSGSVRYCRLSVIDITERKHAEAALRYSEEQYRAVIETSPDGFWIINHQGRLLEVNEAYARLSGYRRDELLHMSIADLEASETPAETVARIHKVTRDGSDLYQSTHRAKSGRVWPVEINIAYWPIDEGRLFVFIRDVNHRQRSEALLKVRMRLATLALTASLDDLIRAALDEAERFTGSQIGFFHFVAADQQNLTMQTWSSRTQTLCAALGKFQHYPINQAGVWVDCVRQRRPIIHNDYAHLPDPHGLPAGHVSLLRELTVPILAEGRVVAIIGVGNKPEDYTPDDVEAMQELTTLIMDVIERKRTEDRIEHLAHHDALTQLPNRVLLTDRLQQAMAQTQRDQKQLAVCYLDLDGFKAINDIYGHCQGDLVLIEAARCLKGCVRAGDTVARMGGDEFVLLLGDLTDVEECEHTLDRIIATLQKPFEAAEPTPISASLGVTLYPDDDSDSDALIRHADQAMYAAKQAGGNRYQLFDAAHDRRARCYRDSLQRIRDGLAVDEFRLYYQPKVNMRNGAVIGAEALIRWQHPGEGLLPPARFIPAVETSDLVIPVGQWVINEALRQMAAWAAQGLPLPVSINLSGRHLQQPGFVDWLRESLAAYPTVQPNWLELEILETVALEDMVVVSRQIEACRQLGVHFALDDFGTGYSSLTYLKHLAVDLLKIDQSFVRGMLADNEALAIVQGVIGLSAAFRRGVIAEGVESIDHGRLLMQLGCDLAQGYQIARPMPPEQIPPWVADWKPPIAWSDVEPASSRFNGA